MKTPTLLSVALLLSLASLAPAADALVDGFSCPPTQARLRAYWWWLNGDVTEAAITRDLEQMKAQGFGGALICDADGSAQDGNQRAPHGPTFFSDRWRELYRHALGEAHRLGLEMSLNVQSGWNMGGPMVTAEQAPKKLVWSESRATGPGKIEQKLVEPGNRGFYRDLFVVAYRLKPEATAAGPFLGLTASAESDGHPAKDMADKNPATFWVGGGKPGDGPTRELPAWVRLEFARPVSVERVKLLPRSGYGPRECEIQASDDGQTFRTLKAFTAQKQGETKISFEPETAKIFRLAIFGAFDPHSADRARNVQIAELELSGQDGTWPVDVAKPATVSNWREKAAQRTLHFSAPDTTPLLEDDPGHPGEEATHAADVVDLTGKFRDGVLEWDVPAGEWQVLRFGCTLSDRCHVSTCSEGWEGYAIDPLDADAFRFYWQAVVEPLIADAGPAATRSLKYLHTDSWEIEPYNWTPTLPAEFLRRRGYDLRPWLPALAGRIVDSRSRTNRFLHDFRKTLGDLAIDHHYRLFVDEAHRHGLQIHPESGGPHAVPIDAQRCLGMDDVPMSEFWAWSWRHRVGDPNRFFVKQPASAAHTYGHHLVAAEGFTTIGPHWQETIWDNLKPAFDKACCEGLNLLVWHAFVCSPQEEGLPGLQYFAGTHFNPQTTWWPKSGPFLAYVDRCQFLLQQGLFAADVCYYYGDHVPNFAQLKASDPAGVLPGYDYDVITEEALLERAAVRDGRIVLPDGMSYRLLVLRPQKAISLPVLRKVKELVDAGATVLGTRPEEATGLAGYPQSDEEVRRLAAALWDQGRVRSGQAGREVLQSLGLAPDFEFAGGDEETSLDFIHRRAAETEIYFVANRGPRAEKLECTFRVADRAPELWDAVHGTMRFLPEYRQHDGRTTLPLEFPPCGSWFVVFRDRPSQPVAPGRNFPPQHTLAELTGPWEVSFDPRWGGPGPVAFEKLDDWSQRPEDGIRFYSGQAVYRKTFDAPPAGGGPNTSEIRHPTSNIFLDLGRVRELAEVRLNGKPLGIVWSPPFRVEVTGALKQRGNVLEVEVVNFWPNRIIGDQSLPAEKRFTRTNIRKLTADTALMPSGLLGPVTLQCGDLAPLVERKSQP